MKQFFAVLAITFMSCQNREETVRPVSQCITESVYASGKVLSAGQYEVYSPVNGIIQTVHVKEGETVRKGDPLVTLVNETQRLAAENAQLTAGYQSLSSNRDKLNEAQEAILLARTKMQNDSALLVRQRRLWEMDIGSRFELEQRELAFTNSKTTWQTALFRFSQLKHQLELAQGQAQKNYQISSRVFNDHIIRANQDGRVYSVLKHPGEMASTQTPVAVLGSQSEFLLELQVDEFDINKIGIGQRVFISMDSHKGAVFEGRVSKIDPIMNPQSRSFTIEALFDTVPAGLFPNLTVEANILIRVKEKALTIPRNYLLDANHVLMKNGEKRRITVGLQDYERVEVLSGLSAGDIIKKPAE